MGPALLSLTLWIGLLVLFGMASHLECCGDRSIERVRFLCSLATGLPALWAWAQLRRAAPEMRARRRAAARALGLVSTGLVAVTGLQLVLPAHPLRYDPAELTVASLYRGAVAYYEAEHRDAVGRVLPRQFPASVGPTPDFPRCRSPRGRHHAPSPVDWNHPSWQALAFALGDGDRGWDYRIELVAEGTGQGAAFTARVLGDLDCDGRFTTYERTGSVDAAGAFKGSPSTSIEEARPEVAVAAPTAEPPAAATPTDLPDLGPVQWRHPERRDAATPTEPPDAARAVVKASGPPEVIGASWMDETTIQISMKDGSRRCVDDKDGGAIHCDDTGGPAEAAEKEPAAVTERDLARLSRVVGKKTIDAEDTGVARSPTGKYLLVYSEREGQAWLADRGGKLLSRFKAESEPQFLGQDEVVVVYSGCVCEGEDARAYDLFPTTRPTRRIQLKHRKHVSSHLASYHFEKDFLWAQQADKVRTWPYRTLEPRVFSTTGRYFADDGLWPGRGKTPLHPRHARDPDDDEPRTELDLHVASPELIYYVNGIGPEIRVFRDTGTAHEVVWRRPSKGIHSVFLSKQSLTGTLVHGNGRVERFTFR